MLAVPVPAGAQWYVGTFTGGNLTQDADVTLDQPALDRRLVFEDVTFEAKPFESPQYYGARLGHLLTDRFGLEVEFLHIKAVARTDRVVRVTGVDAGTPIDATRRMNEIVQRHGMSHGLNFLFANAVWRQPLGAPGGPLTLVLRAGAGPVVPGVDSVVDFQSVQDYQYAGLGAQVAAGVDVRVRGRFSVIAEYKFTGTRPVLDVHRGTGRMTALTHHVAAGFAFGFSR